MTMRHEEREGLPCQDVGLFYIVEDLQPIRGAKERIAKVPSFSTILYTASQKTPMFLLNRQQR
ncbi:hypothetical protein [Mesorhizobium caraganae]|uniref:hypothetical protein n=1 Tax=Mesorhizobium caraganae TaxID=483206 RepID=UPI00333C8FE1